MIHTRLEVILGIFRNSQVIFSTWMLDFAS